MQKWRRAPSDLNFNDRKTENYLFTDMKKTFVGIFIFLVLILAGYLFIYPYDYVVRFEANTFPGTINQSIKLWHKTVGVPGPSWISVRAGQGRSAARFVSSNRLRPKAVFAPP